LGDPNRCEGKRCDQGQKEISFHRCILLAFLNVPQGQKVSRQRKKFNEAFNKSSRSKNWRVGQHLKESATPPK
jgi:hypothetical protein